MSLVEKDLWDKYTAQLVNHVTLGKYDKSKQAICFSGNTLMIDTANKDAEVSNYNIYSIGNLIPENSPFYAPHSDLIGAYSSFLNHIDLGGDYNPNLDSQINIAAQNLTEASDNFLTQTTKSISNWTTMKEAQPNLTWSEYIRQYGKVYTDAKALMDSRQSDYEKLLKQKSGADFQDLLEAQSRIGFTGGARDINTKNSFNMLARVGTEAPLGSTTALPGQTPKPASSSTSEIKLPAYNLDGFKTVYEEWQKKSVSGQSEVTFDINGTTTMANYSEFGWKTNLDGTMFGNFFSIFGAGSSSGNKIKANWQTTNFNLKISYTGLQAFRIEPLSWFQQNFIANYKNKLLPSSPDFFGGNGSLNLLPYQIIVGFEPKIELTLDNSDFKTLKEQFSTSANVSLSIGPFRIGQASFSTYGKKEDAVFNDEASSITVGPIKSTMPLLLGVICSKL